MAPFTAIAHGNLTSPAENAVDQASAIIAGLFVVCAVVCSARKLGVESWIANVSAIGIVFGSGLFHYSTYDGSFTMIYSAALVSGLVLFGVSRLVGRAAFTDLAAVGPPRYRFDAAILLVCTLFLVWIRLPSFLVLCPLLVAGLCLVWRDREMRRKWLAIAGPSVGSSILFAAGWQLFYDHFTLGRWTLSAYFDERIRLTEFRQLDVLFSFTKGLFTWYPIAAVVVIAVLAAREWKLALLLAGVVLPLTALYGSWADWSLSADFGHRGFVETMPVFGVALAVAFQRLGQRIRGLIIGLGAIAVIMCLGLMIAYWHSSKFYDGMTSGQWFAHALGTHSLLAWLARAVA